MGSAIVSKNMQPFLTNTRTFHVGGGVISYLGMVGRFRSDDPHFCDCRSNLVPIVWCNQMQFTPLSPEINQFVSITFSSRATWT